ncbi:ACP S-malonyltransferase [Candidatus Albibeggiatoa sp. nov. NOAA]|uniref:ACP S-malonyltransferase n=1 Tax=Candidatus Albibeggiatoa sp. nov. NOAA TaxID=3162724 RepID=UPI0032F1890A|nr:ACP S-malonyltransferase [Thiotrichaceae bacterium]
MKAVIFPGQGAQYQGMGANLFDQFPDLIAQADSLLGYSIRDLCINDPKQVLNNTLYSQPALYTVNAMSYYEWADRTGEQPSYLAGHSLGEYNALLAAGAFDFVTGLKIVKKRAELMASCSGNYGMAAVLGLPAEETEAVIKDNQLEDLFIANYNTNNQQVISGSISSLQQAEEIFYDNYALNYVMLKVTGAFHSPYMDAASSQFANFLSEFSFKMPTISVIANVTAKPYVARDDIIPNLANHINSPVQWLESVRYLKQKNVKDFIELGGSKILTDMIKHIS